MKYNIGSEMVELDNKQALMSDITTVITLFIASLTGMPVSTTHAKTVSIIAIGKNKNSTRTLLHSFKLTDFQP